MYLKFAENVKLWYNKAVKICKGGKRMLRYLFIDMSKVLCAGADMRAKPVQR